jgi:streptogrisin C
MNYSRPRRRAILLAVTTVIAAAITVTPATRPISASARPSAEVIALANLRHITIAQAQQWLTSQARAEAVAPAFQRQLGAQFAGIWLDPAHPGRIKVATTGRIGAVTQIAMNMGPGVAELVDPVQASASLADLKAVQTDVVNTLGRIRGTRGFVVDVEPQRGATVLSIGPSLAALPAAQQAITTMRARHGARLIIIDWNGEPAALSCAGAYCDPPLRGGVRIYHPVNPNTEAGCTAGFTAKSGTGRYLLTAGHCLSDGETWFSRYADNTPHTIGAAAAVKFPLFDFGAIKINSPVSWNPQPLVYVRPPLTVWEKYPIKGTATAVVNSIVCHTGAKSGGRCGLVKSTSVWVSYSSGGVVIGAVKVGGGLSCGGDSGGPVYGLNKAYGLLSGGSTEIGVCGNTWFYYPIAVALANLNMQLLTAP